MPLYPCDMSYHREMKGQYGLSLSFSPSPLSLSLSLSLSLVRSLVICDNDVKIIKNSIFAVSDSDNLFCYLQCSMEVLQIQLMPYFTIESTKISLNVYQKLKKLVG